MTTRRQARQYPQVNHKARTELVRALWFLRADGGHQHRLDGVHPVFGLVEDHGVGAPEDHVVHLPDVHTTRDFSISRCRSVRCSSISKVGR